MKLLIIQNKYTFITHKNINSLNILHFHMTFYLYNVNFTMAMMRMATLQSC